MKKKLLSLIMAIAMIASMALPALAEESTLSGGQVLSTAGEDGKYSEDVDFQGNTRVAKVKVTLPPATAANQIILNPYQLALKLATQSGDLIEGDAGLVTTGNDTPDQVITVPIAIKSESDVPLEVSVTAKATAADGGEASLSSTPLDGTETTKKVFMYVDMVKTATGARVSDWSDTSAPAWHTDPTKVNTAAYSQVIPTTAGAKRTAIISIPATTATLAATYVYFKVMGQAASAPTKNWTANDKMNLNLAFTFAPTKLHAITQKIMNDNTGEYGTSGAAQAYSLSEANAAPGTSVLVSVKTTAAAPKTFSNVEVVSTADENTFVTVTPIDDTNNIWYFVMPPYPVTINASVQDAG